MLEYPTQVIMVLDSVFWTKITEENYLSPEAEGDLDDWFDAMELQLEEITLLIRGNLKDIQRRTLVALVTQDVHYRDIIEQLRDKGCEGMQVSLNF